MINKITMEEYPEIWDDIIEEEDYANTLKTHRKGSTFYITRRYKIDSEVAPNNPEIWGWWEENPNTWSDDYGADVEVEVLFRVERKEKTVVKIYYERVKDV